MSLAAGSLVLAVLPWWIRIAAGKLRCWTELADLRSRRNLYTAYATSLFVNIAAMFLFWQSCIAVRGIQGPSSLSPSHRVAWSVVATMPAMSA